MNILPDYLKTIPNQGMKKVGLEDIMKFTFKSENDMVSLFIRLIVNLKTDINYKFEKKSCEIKNIKFDINKVKKGKYEIHAFTFTLALKCFIDWYNDNYSKDLYKYINDYLLSKKEDLYFTDFNFDMDSGDREKANQIIDALCVKFYNEILFALNLYFNKNNNIISIKGDEKNNNYIFTFRPMNLIELNETNQGKLIINSKG